MRGKPGVSRISAPHKLDALFCSAYFERTLYFNSYVLYIVRLYFVTRVTTIVLGPQYAHSPAPPPSLRASCPFALIAFFQLGLQGNRARCPGGGGGEPPRGRGCKRRTHVAGAGMAPPRLFIDQRGVLRLSRQSPAVVRKRRNLSCVPVSVRLRRRPNGRRAEITFGLCAALIGSLPPDAARTGSLSKAACKHPGVSNGAVPPRGSTSLWTQLSVCNARGTGSKAPKLSS